MNDLLEIISFRNFKQIIVCILLQQVGDVKALPLPMACTLTQFQDGNKYYFTVRAVDQYGRCGTYSDASEIFLNKN